jgi:2-desacetyl-2-hydroxyethyl bacteriochlorophyllide A dehydrogenase
MTIRKIIFSRPGEVTFAALEVDLAPTSPMEIVIQNHFSLVSAGTELACLSGGEPWFPLPGTPGYGAVGRVLETGSGVTKVHAGDMVFTHGPHAERFKFDSTDRYTGTCVRLPEGINPEHALFARMVTIAMCAIRVSHIELGDRVLVTGLGQIGNFAAQLAQLQGGRVIGADINPRRRLLAQTCGIEHTLDSQAANWQMELGTAIGGEKISTVIEASGLSSVATQVVPLVAPHGEIVLLGTPRQSFQCDVTELFRHIHLPGFIEFRGALEWRYPTFRQEFSKHSIERNSEIALDLIRTGRIRVSPLCTHKIRPEGAADAYAHLKSDGENYVGVIFDWASDS